MLLALSLGLKTSNSRHFIGRCWRDYAFLLWSTEKKPTSSQHGKHFCMARAILYLITVYDAKSAYLVSPGPFHLKYEYFARVSTSPKLHW